MAAVEVAMGSGLTDWKREAELEEGNEGKAVAEESKLSVKPNDSTSRRGWK